MECLGPATTSTLIGLLIIFACVVLPLIPSVIIYKVFPDTAVGVNGALANLKINATGAFAAYIIVFLLIKPIVDATFDSSRGISNATWITTAKVKLLDPDGNPLTDTDSDAFYRSLNVSVIPDHNVKTRRQVRWILPEYDPDTQLQFSISGFATKSVLLADAKSTDPSSNKVDLGVVELHRITQDYDIDQEPVPLELGRGWGSPEDIVGEAETMPLLGAEFQH